LIGYSPDVYNYFAEQAHLCGLDLNLTYPQQGGHFPTLLINYEDDSSFKTLAADRKSYAERKAALRKAALHPAVVSAMKIKRKLGRRNLEGRANGTIDEWYGCYLFDELWDYAVNYTFPWSR
jgi:carboxypeptidase D